jgi:hypothetical protein
MACHGQAINININPALVPDQHETSHQPQEPAYLFDKSPSEILPRPDIVLTG